MLQPRGHATAQAPSWTCWRKWLLVPYVQNRYTRSIRQQKVNKRWRTRMTTSAGTWDAFSPCLRANSSNISLYSAETNSRGDTLTNAISYLAADKNIPVSLAKAEPEFLSLRTWWTIWNGSETAKILVSFLQRFQFYWPWNWKTIFFPFKTRNWGKYLLEFLVRRIINVFCFLMLKRMVESKFNFVKI